MVSQKLESSSSQRDVALNRINTGAPQETEAFSTPVVQARVAEPESFLPWYFPLLELDLVPTPLLRWGIRQQLAAKLAYEGRGGAEAQQERLTAFVTELKQSPIALYTAEANQQHYELPCEFFAAVLGPHLKYSSGYWPEPNLTLADAEAAMLDLTCQRAQIQDGQTILDLGCGWGSLSLWVAEHYPNASIVSLSNSQTQKQWIDAQAAQRGFNNLKVVTQNIATFEGFEPDCFDRVVSVEMFEHMKNYQHLLNKLARWLKPEGQLFVHIFTHRLFAYHYDHRDPDDWLSQHFFTGGTMPSHDLLLHFQQDFNLTRRWWVNGQHYEKTANAWLDNFEAKRSLLWPMLEATYGKAAAKRWWVYWKLFFLACAELWGYAGGDEWGVSHYLFSKA